MGAVVLVGIGIAVSDGDGNIGGNGYLISVATHTLA